MFFGEKIMKSYIKLNKLFLALAAVLFLFQFSLFAQNAPASKFGTEKWILKKIGDARVAGDRVFIQFDEANGRFGGRGGCNGMGGNLQVEGSKIGFSGIISTKMFCEDASELENKFFGTLEKVDNFKMKKGKLLLYEGDRLVMKLMREKDKN
jgi:heat shock protein HslJ